MKVYLLLKVREKSFNLKIFTFQVVKKAETDAIAKKAVLLHYKYLMRNAQTLCVGLQAKGVFLAGDNQVPPKNTQ